LAQKEGGSALAHSLATSVRRSVVTTDHGLQLTYYIIAVKEKMSSIYKENKLELDTLSDEKKTKIKRFAREYIQGPTSTRERRAASTNAEREQ
jgi:hypothetical protein